jgi:hypothetical protein
MVGAYECIMRFNAFVDIAFKAQAEAALIEWMNELAKISSENYAPEKTGLMISTLKVEIIEQTSTIFKVRISYGGDGKAPYTVHVHEIPYHHTRGQWHFLSEPFFLQIPNLQFKLEQIKLAEVTI